MNIKQRRQYEMVLRVRDFGKTHGRVFSTSGMGLEVLRSINTTVDEIAATALAKVSAAAAARAHRKRRARQDLSELLVKVSQLARVLRARGHTVPAFVLPASRSDLEVLITARQFARDAAGFEAQFTGHGMGSAVIAAAADAFEQAMSDRGAGRAGHVAALARTKELLAEALLDVRRLDLIVANELRKDPVTTAVWRQARRVGGRPSLRVGGASEAASSTAPADSPERQAGRPWPPPRPWFRQLVAGR